MNNLLPAFQGRADQPSEAFVRLGAWEPAKADARNPKNVPYGLGVSIKDDVYVEKFLTNVPPLADPNHRDAKSIYGDDPSPLSLSQRGEVEYGRISMPKIGEDSTTTLMRLAKQVPKELPLLISVSNLHDVCLDMFMQRAGNMRSFVLQPDMQCTRNLSQLSDSTSNAVDSGPPLSVCLSTVDRVSVTVTFRHELRSFDFLPGPIGMEVEYKFRRLLCTGVLPNSQAARFSELLDGAEVVAVNGRRVLSLDDFRRAVVEAQSYGRVTLTAACYKAGKQKVDKFYESLSGKSRSTAKSLLMGLLGGKDTEHQHDIALPTAEQHYEEDDEDDDIEGPLGERGENLSDADSRADSKGVSTVTVPTLPNSRSGSINTAASNAIPSSRPTTSDIERKHQFNQDTANASDSDESDTDNVTSIRKKKATSHAASPKTSPQPVVPANKYATETEEDEGMMVIRRSEHKMGLASKDVDEEFEPTRQEEEGDEDIRRVSSVQVFSGATNAQIDVGADKFNNEGATADPEWDYTTALDIEEALPFSRILCVPKVFQKSSYWGDPDKCIQFSNYSSRWDVSINWVDEEGGVVQRALLKAAGGKCKHMELTSTRSVWCLIATPVGEASSAAPRDEDSIADESVSGPHVVPDKSPVVMLLRCSKASLQPRKYTSVIWTPWRSVAATQRMKAKQLPEHKRAKNTANDELQPACIVQVMDGSMSNS